MNYRRAMRQAEDELKTRPFNLNLLKDLHAALLDGVRGKFKARGNFAPRKTGLEKPARPLSRRNLFRLRRVR